MSTTQNTRTCTVSETARWLRVPERVVTRLIAEGQFETSPASTGLLITANSVNAFIERLITSSNATGSASVPTRSGAVPRHRDSAEGPSVRPVADTDQEGATDGAGGEHEAGGRHMSAGRRGNGEGAPYKRKDGRWEIKFYVDDPVTGQRKRMSVYDKKRAEAIKSMKEILARSKQGAPLRDSSVSVGAWAQQWTTTTLPVLPISENYRDQMASLATKHLFVGALASIPLNHLRPTAVEAWMAELQTRTRALQEGTEAAAGRRALSESTVRSLYLLLRKILDAAVRDGMIAKNPVALVAPPRVSRSSVVKLSPAEVTRLLHELRATRYFPAFAFVAATGVRRGEVLALRWDDVDLDSRVAWIHTTMSSAKGGPRESAAKTERSRRQIVFPEPVADILRAWRKQQAAERLRAGSRWQDSGKVFTTDEGGVVDPRNLLRTLKVAARAAGLPPSVNVHTLRHSAATAMLEAGVHVKAVSDSLGHSSAQITLDVYGFTADKVARAAAEGLALAFGITADADEEAGL